MNAKKAKRVRRTLRRMGLDVSEARYIETNRRRKAHRFLTLTPEGAPTLAKVEYRTYTAVLGQECGRSYYKAAKAAAARCAP